MQFTKYLLQPTDERRKEKEKSGKRFTAPSSYFPSNLANKCLKAVGITPAGPTDAARRPCRLARERMLHLTWKVCRP
jgi:hypothetical protein